MQRWKQIAKHKNPVCYPLLITKTHSLKGKKNMNEFAADGYGLLKKKYIFYNSTVIYAIYYKQVKTVYYNLNFKSTTGVIVFKQ